MDRISNAVHRVRELLRVRPERGRRVVISHVRLDEQLRCTVVDGAWTLPVDMSTNTGGDGSAPDPGVYARAALGACVAIAYRMWAAADGLVLEGVDVEVQADNDAAGLFGVSDAAPGYQAVRLLVRIQSSAEPTALARALDAAESHSPYLSMFRRPVPVAVQREVVVPEGAQA